MRTTDLRREDPPEADRADRREFNPGRDHEHSPAELVAAAKRLVEFGVRQGFVAWTQMLLRSRSQGIAPILASDEFSVVNGVALMADGGSTLGDVGGLAFEEPSGG